MIPIIWRKKLIALSGHGDEVIEFVTDRLGHDIRYALDSSKAMRELGWKPKVDFATGLADTFAYYKSKS